MHPRLDHPHPRRRQRPLAGAVALALALAACSSKSPVPAAPAADADHAFAAKLAEVTEHLFKAEPGSAVALGIHAFDGRVPDVSPAALDAVAATLAADLAAVTALRPRTPQQALERAVMRQELRASQFRLVELDSYRRNPMAYAGAINLDTYISRDYAPVAQRAAAVVAQCNALPAFFAQARASLTAPMPRTWVDTALLQITGYGTFVDQDVRAQLRAAQPPLADLPAIERALDACKATFAEHAAWLTAQQPKATAPFALGERRFLAMLAATQGIELDLATLTRLAEADLQRNYDAMLAAAAAIDPSRPALTVIAESTALRAAPDQIVATAAAQAVEARAFVADHAIATIPSDDIAEVRESPAFARWNSASLDVPGPFEEKPLPSFFYISPPDPAWPADVQRDYIIPTRELLFTTVHELWPGHFLHRLHIQRHASPTVRSFCTSSTSEGWAHYTEEMMFDAGFGGGTPIMRMAMLKEALLRNVRFVVALREHTGGMTVEQATQLFAERGFVDPGNAKQQAVRGTFDPMFLVYTLGKLVIRKLHTDYVAAHPGASLRDFHDAFLAHACAPLPEIRRQLLGPDAGPVL